VPSGPHEPCEDLLLEPVVIRVVVLFPEKHDVGGGERAIELLRGDDATGRDLEGEPNQGVSDLEAGNPSVGIPRGARRRAAVEPRGRQHSDSHDR